ADGKVAFIDVTGKLPVTRFIPNAQAPIVRAVTQASTGGALAGGIRIYGAVTAFDADGKQTPPSNIFAVTIEDGTDTNMATLTGIEWPAGTYAGYKVYFSTNERTICRQIEVEGSLPTEIQIPGPILRSTENLP